MLNVYGIDCGNDFDPAGRRRQPAVFMLLAGLLAVAVLAPSRSTAAEENGAGAPTRLNKVIELFEANKPAFGIFSYGRSMHNAIALGASRLDFVLIDMEHAPVDFETLQAFVLAMNDKRRVLEKGTVQPDVVPFVRLPQYGREKLQFLIKQVLDLGVFGVMLPHIETADQALTAVRAARYPQVRGAADAEPAGQRGLADDFGSYVWGVSNDHYVRRADVWPHDPRGEILLIHQIESKQGVVNLEEILAVPGIGVIFVGPADLSSSLGVPMDDPLVEQAIQRILQATLARGIPCGITADKETAARRLQQGFRFLALGEDVGPGGPASAVLDVIRP